MLRFMMLLGFTLLLCQPLHGQFKEVGQEYQRGNPQFVAVFRDLVARPGKSTVRILCDGKETALGMVVSGDGWVLTKANDLHGAIACKLRDGRTVSAKLVGVHSGHDLALLKLAVQGLPGIAFGTSKSLGVGNWIACAGPSEEPVAIGIVSVATRVLPAQVVASDQGYLGVAVEQVDGVLRIIQVVADMPAAQAGVKVQDVLLAVQGQTVAGTDGFVDVMQQHKVGDVVSLRVKRGAEEIQMKTTLARRPTNTRGDFQNRMGSDLSSRTTGYATILQHDAVIRPRDCGGPVVDLDGKVVGINICRAGRTESWAIPSEIIQAVLPDLMEGKLPPKMPSRAKQ